MVLSTVGYNSFNIAVLKVLKQVSVLFIDSTIVLSGTKFSERNKHLTGPILDWTTGLTYFWCLHMVVLD